jgi:hypothetical protein
MKGLEHAEDTTYHELNERCIVMAFMGHCQGIVQAVAFSLEIMYLASLQWHVLYIYLWDGWDMPEAFATGDT